MAKPHHPVVPRFRWNYVGRADLLLHVARWTIRKAGEGSETGSALASLDGAQRRLLHGRKEKFAERRSRAGAVVPVGSADDVVERRRAALLSLLLEQRTD